jgi:DNA helicase HerA-like ATPase
VFLPLRNLGNVLVAGLPGSGKSELLASMLAGLLRQDSTGQRVQVATVDSKLVTFGNLPPLAAMYAPPALEIDDAHALVWRLVEEVRRRFQLLQAAGVRSVEEYQSKTGEALPYVVTVIDELADMTADHDRRRAAAFNGAAMEIGRKGRAAGVALVMATQRPSADVIPSSLRNLAGAAVAFRLARADDSRLVLDAPGAEQLPSTPGRCLVRHRDTVQAQAYFSGLEGGQFDGFLASLPHVDRIEAAGWPIRHNDTGSVIAGDMGPEGASTDAITAWSSTDQSDYTPEQEAQILAMYEELGSLRAVQRELYGQTGGYWFYRIRNVIDGR